MKEKPPSVRIEEHLKDFQIYLCGFLGDVLPKICVEGSDWWMLLVRSIPHLKGSQSSRIRSGAIAELGKLDLVSLCGVLKHNWRSICEKTGIDDPQRLGALKCDTLINLRNTLSHLGTENTLNQEDLLAALLSIKKLSQLMSAPEELVTALDKDLQDVMRIISGSGVSASNVSQTGESGHALGIGGDMPYGPLPPRADQGIPLAILAGEGETRDEVEAALSLTTFIGIDFGTSTTIASYVYLDPLKGILTTAPIPIPQLDRMGRTIEDHLVPSCVAWADGKLLIGHGAADLKTELSPGVDTWFSFKMELGVNLGPKYFRSKLDGKEGRIEIRTPQDVASFFFQYLREHIEAWVAAKGLPREIRYAVSVPAAFEANQRLDLCRVMNRAGINVGDSSIIDEPNAAFISHLLDTLAVGDGVLKSFCDRPVNTMVFDFGAGTCDISVLHVCLQDDRLVSRNLAISQFRALGGDNIDRQIARKVLWPAIEKICLKSGEHLRSIELEQVVLPRLQPVAEQLKVQCCKWISARAQGGDLSIYRESDEKVATGPIPPIQVGGHRLELPEPSISLKEFFTIMEPFLATGGNSDDPEVISVFDPIDNALDKAGIKREELDMVLFIGGSAQNPLVQDAVQSHFGRFVACVVRPDIRTPVSRGTALHSLTWNGLEMQFIRPITSETIYILTTGNKLHPVIPAGSPIPSPDVMFTDALVVPNDNQERVELPICVSSASKILHILELKPSDGSLFQSGDRITVSARLDQNKLLHITAKSGRTMTKGELINPLSNGNLTPEETRRLIARQKLNESIVHRGGKPTPKVLKDFADACADSGAHMEAAESYESLERIDPKHKTSENATLICYHYSRCDRHDLSDQWAERSHQRKPTWVSAFNLALAMERSKRDDRALELLEEAHRVSPRNPVVMASLGDRLLTGNDAKRGRDMLAQALDLFREQMNHGSLDVSDIRRAKRLAGFFNDREFTDSLGKYEAAVTSKAALYSESHLVTSINNEKLAR